MKSVALLSDFGHVDPYVGIMKSVMTSIAPDLRFIDLSHEVPPQNVLSGAYVLRTVADFLPHGAIVLGVVDPGVGTDRRAVIVETEKFTLVGPDNGLFSMALESFPAAAVYDLSNTKYFLPNVSSTFHGRDIFAPVVAHYANGVAANEFGNSVDPNSMHRFTMDIGPLIKDDCVDARVMHIDHFGNVATNLSKKTFKSLNRDLVSVTIHGTPVAFGATFGDVKEGQPVAYFSSTGYLEIGVRNGDAGKEFQLRQRDLIHVLTK